VDQQQSQVRVKARHGDASDLERQEYKNGASEASCSSKQPRLADLFSTTILKSRAEAPKAQESLNSRIAQKWLEHTMLRRLASTWSRGRSGSEMRRYARIKKSRSLLKALLEAEAQVCSHTRTSVGNETVGFSFVNLVHACDLAH
jgi:hypothetical protein